MTTTPSNSIFHFFGPESAKLPEALSDSEWFSTMGAFYGTLTYEQFLGLRIPVIVCFNETLQAELEEFYGSIGFQKYFDMGGYPHLPTAEIGTLILHSVGPEMLRTIMKVLSFYTTYPTHSAYSAITQFKDLFNDAIRSEIEAALLDTEFDWDRIEKRYAHFLLSVHTALRKVNITLESSN